MSFEVYVQCFGENESTGIPRAVVRSLFPIIPAESKPDFWRVRYDAQNSCHISVTALPSNKEMLKSFCVERPCGDSRLWEALITVLRMGSIVMFWPGGPPSRVICEAGLLGVILSCWTPPVPVTTWTLAP